MSYLWKWQDVTLEHFSPKEFDRPELMDVGYLQDLDTLRMRCGFPIRINDDARNEEDLARIYRKEIAKGEPYPKDSAHLWKKNHQVCASDIEPEVPKPDDGSDLTLDERELELLYQILRLWKEGRWKLLGLIVETGHFHVDNARRLEAKRPYFGTGISR